MLKSNHFTLPEIDTETHNPIVQAVAFRLIRILRNRYPNIASFFPDTGEYLTTGNNENTSTDTSTTLAQHILYDYLDQVIRALRSASNVSSEATTALPAFPSIAGTWKMIAFIEQSTLFTPADKILVLEQMQRIADIHPRGSWDKDQEQWSINCAYNPETKTLESLISPPAETLNLVCQAIFDHAHCEGGDAELNDRVTGFFLHLSDLRKQIIAGQLEKCSAGLQHDLLYLLNHSYLVEGSPIHLPMDDQSLLLDTLTTFVVRELQSHDNEATQRMILQWVQWTHQAAEEEQSPCITWLENLYPYLEAGNSQPVRWKAICLAFITKHCESLWVNPKNYDIQAYIDGLQYLPIPQTHYKALPDIIALMATKPLSITYENGLLDTLGNQALTDFQTSEDNLLDSKYTLAIQNLWQVTKIVSLLRQDRFISYWINEEENTSHETRNAFHEAQNALHKIALDYFQSTDSWQTHHLPSHLEPLITHYNAKKNAYFKSTNIEWIKRIFIQKTTGNQISSQEQQDWKKTWEAIEAIHNKQSLCLTNTQLEALLNWIQSEEAHAETAPYVLPYIINRLFAHGLLTPDAWSPLYCTSWLNINAYFSESNRFSHSKKLMAIKEAYRPCLFVNYQFIALVQQANDLEPAIRTAILSEFKATFAMGLKKLPNMFVATLKCYQNAKEELRIIWNAVQHKLSTLIQDGSELWSLFSGVPLNTELRTSILNSLNSQRLNALIHNDELLCLLLQLQPENLSLQERTIILKALKNDQRLIVNDASKLQFVLNLPLNKLDSKQRLFIIKTLGKNLALIIRNTAQLRSLFTLPVDKLDLELRTRIIKKLDRLDPIIQTPNDLYDLFTLLPTLLNEKQRTAILEKTKDRLNLIPLSRNGFQLFFQLPLNQLSPKQRGIILESIGGKIQTANEIDTLFKLSKQEFNAYRRSTIVTMLIDKWSTIIKDTSDLQLIVKLVNRKLITTEQCLIIITNLHEKISLLGDNLDYSNRNPLETLLHAEISQSENPVVFAAYLICCLNNHHYDNFQQGLLRANARQKVAVLFTDKKHAPVLRSLLETMLRRNDSSLFKAFQDTINIDFEKLFHYDRAMQEKISNYIHKMKHYGVHLVNKGKPKGEKIQQLADDLQTKINTLDNTLNKDTDCLTRKLDILDFKLNGLRNLREYATDISLYQGHIKILLATLGAKTISRFFNKIPNKTARFFPEEPSVDRDETPTPTEFRPSN